MCKNIGLDGNGNDNNKILWRIYLTHMEEYIEYFVIWDLVAESYEAHWLIYGIHIEKLSKFDIISPPVISYHMHKMENIFFYILCKTIN